MCIKYNDKGVGNSGKCKIAQHSTLSWRKLIGLFSSVVIHRCLVHALANHKVNCPHMGKSKYAPLRFDLTVEELPLILASWQKGSGVVEMEASY